MANSERTFLGHPLGLYVLFLSEMWERFCYYGMRALLVLYMVNVLNWTQKDASTIYKIYTSLVYVTPILGGYLADRFLGNTAAVVIGGILMALGSFFLAEEGQTFFYFGLAFLIFGNGFFKPNMSTQVGRLYPRNDPRRDSAYTIFYMGINLGACIAPFACGWLRTNTVGEYHAGFAAAGVGMIVGLAVYLLGKPLVKELRDDSASVPKDATHTKSAAISEAEAERTPSTLGWFHDAAPRLLSVAGIVFVVISVVAVWVRLQGDKAWAARMPEWSNGVVIGIVGLCVLLLGYVAGQVKNAVRDRVLAIAAAALPVMLFWAAFEQKGNVLNLWADKHTNRYLTKPASEPSTEIKVASTLTAEVGGERSEARTGLDRWLNLFKLKSNSQSAAAATTGSVLDPVPAEYFQSINPFAIIIFAPLFAMLWLMLERRGMQPSIPMKMATGLMLMCLAMTTMTIAAKSEAGLTSIPYAGSFKPDVNDSGRVVRSETESPTARKVPAAAGRLMRTNEGLELNGVLTDVERLRILASAAPMDFRASAWKLAESAEDLPAGERVSVPFEPEQNVIQKLLAGTIDGVTYDSATKALVATRSLDERRKLSLAALAADRDYANAIDALYRESSAFKVSPFWLVITYLLMTFGELCLSPVGLSMASKLAPARFATLVMGLWMLTSAFGHFIGGALGESWGSEPPPQFFLRIVVLVGAAGLLAFFFARKLTAAMHGVK